MAVSFSERRRLGTETIPFLTVKAVLRSSKVVFSLPPPFPPRACTRRLMRFSQGISPSFIRMFPLPVSDFLKASKESPTPPSATSPLSFPFSVFFDEEKAFTRVSTSTSVTLAFIRKGDGSSAISKLPSPSTVPLKAAQVNWVSLTTPPLISPTTRRLRKSVPWNVPSLILSRPRTSSPPL